MFSKVVDRCRSLVLVVLGVVDQTLQDAAVYTFSYYQCLYRPMSRVSEYNNRELLRVFGPGLRVDHDIDCYMIWKHVQNGKTCKYPLHDVKE